MAAFVRANWFYCLLPFLLFAAWSLSINPEATADPLTLERVYLFDFGLFLPLLYFLYLRSRFSMRAVLLRVAALAGAGIWLASLLMPDGEGQVLPWLAWVRFVALPLLIAIELAAFAAIMRQVWSREPDEQALLDQGIPPLIVRLMIAEARFWKRVWGWLGGR